MQGVEEGGRRDLRRLLGCRTDAYWSGGTRIGGHAVIVGHRHDENGLEGVGLPCPRGLSDQSPQK